MKPLLTTPGSMWNVQDGGASDFSQPVKFGAPAQVDPSAEGVDQSSDGYFDASRDLQRSLEQLLRMQSEQVKAKLESQPSRLSEEPMLLPSVLADDVVSMTKMER